MARHRIGMKLLLGAGSIFFDGKLNQLSS